MAEVTLSLMLKARDERVALQRELIEKYRCPLICFTMNIAGPVKTSPAIERAFNEGIKALEEKLPREKILYRQTDISPIGCQAMMCVLQEAQMLKDICTDIEDSCPLGRLFDMDVIDTDFTKLSRKSMRGCMVCNAPGRSCAAGRVHSVAALQETTRAIIHRHFLEADSTKIASLAVESLLDEVYTTPKPGLVDKRNNGSHTDMNTETFVKSALSLKDYLRQFMVIGSETSDKTPAHTFLMLRKAGVKAEEAMYNATGGINTHKGAIYSMGIVCGAVGRLYTVERPVAPVEDILCQCRALAKNALDTDFAGSDCSTAGKRLHREYGLTGIRGEAAQGFPSVTDIALPVYNLCLNKGMSSNDAGAVSLIHLIAHAQDTNLYKRGGKDGALYATNAAKSLIQKYTQPPVSEIEKLDDDFIKRNLSPGGCADLLAIMYFLNKLKDIL